MKNALKRSLSILLAITIIFSSAYVGFGEVDWGGLFTVRTKAASGSDLTFTLNDDGQSYSVTHCSMNASGEIVIPKTYNGFPVTSIGDSAFRYCTNLTSITIPDSITSIGEWAFDECYSLNKVNISDIAAWCKIDFYRYESNPLFRAENLYLNNVLVTDLVIPDGVTSIRTAFWACKSLNSVTIPESVMSIGDYAFGYCTNLTSITIPDSVTSIGFSAFYSCTSLTSITIPANVTSIYEYAFSNCTSLRDVYYGGTVADWANISIGYDNSYLTDATIHYHEHTYNGDWIIDLQPTCTNEGSEYRTCSGCGNIETRAIVSFGHDFDYDNYEYVINPDNSAEYVKQHKCKICDETTLGEETFIAVVTVDDLYNVRNNLAGNYVLMNDIDLTEATARGGNYDCSGNGWEPIGTLTKGFTGIFDGNGYKINGLRIDVTTKPNDDSVLSLGLFARVSGTVKNLSVSGLIKSTVKTEGYVGAIAGYVQDGKIINCHSSCNIMVANSYAYKVGGIVGKVITYNDKNEFVIEQCSNTGNINAYLCTAGGIVGCALDGGTISCCYNSGDIITGDYRAGSGIVDYWSLEQGFYKDVLTISNCYNSGAVANGICTYYNYNTYKTDLIVTNCYNVAISTYPIVDNSSGNVEASKESCYAVSGSKYPQYGDTILSEAAMREQASYSGFDFDTVWIIDDTDGYPYPQLRSNPHNSTDCEHVYEEDWIVDTNPTCETTGSKHKNCIFCDAVITEEIPVSHFNTEWITEKEPTCTEAGYKDEWCLDCFEIVNTEEIPATGHINTEWITEKNPTCTEVGQKDEWCLDCGEVVASEEIPATGHLNTEWIIEQEPTCDVAGYKDEWCLDCGDMIGSEEIPANGHSYSEEWTIDIEPTCTDEGIKSRHCTVCDSAVTDVIVIVKLGHKFEIVSTADEHPHINTFKCSRCPETKEDDSYSEVCGICNFSYTDNGDGTCTITGYIGSSASMFIPALIDGKIVVTTTTGAFKSNTALTSITIEDGVQGIGSLAFLGCSALSKAVIPASVTSIGTKAFYNCSSDFTIYCYSGSYAMQYAIDNSINYVVMDILETENSTIDYTKKLIFATITGAEDITEFLNIPEASTITVAASLVVGDKEYLGTGSVIAATNNDVKTEYTLVVEGDTNGDSICNVLDVFDAERASNGHLELSGAYAMAADSNSDDTIDIYDYQAIVNKALAS